MERDGIKALQGGERVVYVGDEEAQQGGVTFMMSEGKESLNGMDANQQEDH